MQTKRLFIYFFVLALFFPLSAEDPLPSGYRGIQLGMSVDQVKEALRKDLSFGYRGDRDVSLLPGENRTLIETDTSKTAPYSFLDRCWFQFYENRLYTITLNLRRSKIDHYSVFSSLSEKYGNPGSLSPEKSEWKDSGVIMSLERPLTLKYTDRKIFEQLQADALVGKSADEMARDEFLEGL